jgi:energy-coupling factor transporter ATP-binding protein EcfA2
MAGARVSLTGVTKTYRLGDGSRLAAADEVTLAVEAGERVALVGPSGSGKSTLLHLMGAVDVPDEGTITVDDQTIVVAFQGAMVGTLLGDAVALQVRAPDLIAAGCLTLLGVVAVATIGFLGIIEDATSYAALQAVGWRDTSLGGALATQAALIGAVGGVAGGALGIGLVAWLVGDLNPATLTVAAAAAAFLILLAIAASLAPAAWLRRLPVARILAEE